MVYICRVKLKTLAVFKLHGVQVDFSMGNRMFKLCYYFLLDEQLSTPMHLPNLLSYY